MKKLVQLQAELKAPKGQMNKFGGYKYRSCEDIVEAVKPIASKLGLYLTLSDEIQLIGDRYYIRATASIIDTETGEKVETTAYARESETKKGMDDSQITGTASSYARKYALNGLLMIDDTKDADTEEYTNQQYPEKGKGKTKEAEAVSKERTAPSEHNAFDTGEKIDKIKQNALLALITQKGTSLGAILKHYEITGLQNMTMEQFMHCKETLERKPDKETENGIQEPKK